MREKAVTMTEIQPRFRSIDGLSVRYATSDENGGGREALLLSPWPESLYSYDAMWSRLAPQARLVAVDLPGFGHSELRADLLTPSAMGEFIVRIADAFGLEEPHVVGPDVGTAASLFAAARHPGRFRTLVVGTGGTAVPVKLGSPLSDWVFAEDLAPYRAMPPKAAVTAAIGTIDGYELPEVVREDYLASYVGERFADQIPYVHSYLTELPVLGELLPSLQTPVQIIAGRKDTVVPLENAEYLDRLLPDSRLDVLDVGHFAWEEGADAYADAVIRWWVEH
jgi:pimeloyl-ACP methyl ester carboxylesterase